MANIVVRDCTKTAYPSKGSAENAMHKIWRRAFRGGSHKLPCRVYRCNYCNLYHMTSQPLRAQENHNV